jgi:hypothetical protein
MHTTTSLLGLNACSSTKFNFTVCSFMGLASPPQTGLTTNLPLDWTYLDAFELLDRSYILPVTISIYT